MNERQTRSQSIDTTCLEDIDSLNKFIIKIIEIRDSIPCESREGAEIDICIGSYYGDIDINICYSRPETDEELEKRIATNEHLAKLHHERDLNELKRLQIKLGITK